MLPKYHLIIGLIISTLLYLIFNLTLLQVFIIFLASFLIDFDHYLYYAFKKKNFNPKYSHKNLVERRKYWLRLSKKEKQEYKRPLILFHGIEFWILLFILSFFHKMFIFVLIGIFIHIIVDYIEILYFKEVFYHKFSQVWVVIKKKNKKDFFK